MANLTPEEVFRLLQAHITSTLGSNRPYISYDSETAAPAAPTETDMATKAKAKTKPLEAPPSPELPFPLRMESVLRPSRVRVVVVGVGGIGTRVLFPLMRMLRRGDELVLIDHDKVEEKNLRRQHFFVEDVGDFKVEATGARWQEEASRLGITLRILATPFSWEHSLSDLTPPLPTILLGCVDNRLARLEMLTFFYHSPLGTPIAWIDAGNILRGGQVMLNLRAWPLRAWEIGTPKPPAPQGANLYTTLEQTPTIVEKGEVEEITPTPGCDERIDLQSVAVNNLMAALQVNLISILLDGIQFSIAGWFAGIGSTASAVAVRKGPNRSLLTTRPADSLEPRGWDLIERVIHAGEREVPGPTPPPARDLGEAQLALAT